MHDVINIAVFYSNLLNYSGNLQESKLTDSIDVINLLIY